MNGCLFTEEAVPPSVESLAQSILIGSTILLSLFPASSSSTIRQSLALVATCVLAHGGRCLSLGGRRQHLLDAGTAGISQCLADLFVGNLVGHFLPVCLDGRRTLDFANKTSTTGSQDVEYLHGNLGFLASLGDKIGLVVIEDQLSESFVSNVVVNRSASTANNIIVSQGAKGRRRCKGGRTIPVIRSGNGGLGWNRNWSRLDMPVGRARRDSSGWLTRCHRWNVLDGLFGRRGYRALVFLESVLWRMRVVISTMRMGVVMGRRRPNWLIKASALATLIPGHGRGSRARGEGNRRRNIVVGERWRRWRRRAEVVSIVGFFARKELIWMLVRSTPAIAWGIGWRIGLSSNLMWRWRGHRFVIFFGSLLATVANFGPRSHVAPEWRIDGDWSSGIGIFKISRRVNVEELEMMTVRRPGIVRMVVGAWVRRVVFTAEARRRIIRRRIGASGSFAAVLHAIVDGGIGVNLEMTGLSLLGNIAGGQCSVVEGSHIVAVFVLVSCLKGFRWR